MKIKMLDYIMSMHSVCQFRSTENPPGPASNSEIRRLVDQAAFRVNGQAYKCNDIIELPVTSLVVFPKKRRTTIL